jgi:hypothetical protein
MDTIVSLYRCLLFGAEMHRAGDAKPWRNTLYVTMKTTTGGKLRHLRSGSQDVRGEVGRPAM